MLSGSTSTLNDEKEPTTGAGRTFDSRMKSCSIGASHSAAI